MPDHLGCGAAPQEPHPGLEAQLNVVCNKIELIRNLLEKEVLMSCWTKALPPDIIII